MITIHLNPEVFLGVMLAIAIILMCLARFWPEKKEQKHKTRSPKEIEKLEKELARIKKALK